MVLLQPELVEIYGAQVLVTRRDAADVREAVEESGLREAAAIEEGLNNFEAGFVFLN